jgi:hypothetical protein
MAENIQQALQLATTNPKLAILPTFSNDSRDDKISATKWLQKVINNKQGDGWTNLQTATCFKNALRGEVFKRNNAQSLLDVNNLSWDIVKPNLNKIIEQPLPSLQQFRNYQKLNRKTFNQ